MCFKLYGNTKGRKMEDKVHGAFVSEKVSKVRWKPEDLVESDIFLTGSWDNEVSNITSLARLK